MNDAIHVFQARERVYRRFNIWIKRVRKNVPDLTPWLYHTFQLLAMRTTHHLYFRHECLFFPGSQCRITINSLMYVGFDCNTTDEFISYFKNCAQKQIGSHLFIHPFKGELSMFQTGLVGLVNEYSATKVRTVYAIYPILVTKVAGANPSLALGLRFGAQPTDLRYYYRFNRTNVTTGVQTGDVCELFDNEFVNIHQRRNGINRNQRSFAIYVGLGAKLVVTDNYHAAPVPNITDNPDPHNRAFVQQGGVVVVERETELRIRTINFTNDEWSTLSYAIRTGIVNPNTESAGDDRLTFRNPVIFIGANESDHNSIAWELSIDRTNGKMDCMLSSPEGGYILAIEEWDEGIDEIMCRHKFEQLYRLNVIPDGVDWGAITTLAYEAPEEIDMLIKILGAGMDRSYNCNIRQLLPPSIPLLYTQEQKPKEFNFWQRRPNLTPRDVYTMPPLYPPVLINGQLFYLPNRVIQYNTSELDIKVLNNFEEHYKRNEFYKLESSRVENILSNDGKKYRLELDNGIHKIENECHYKLVTTNPLPEILGTHTNYRYGLDGRLYERDDNTPIGAFETRFFTVQEISENELPPVPQPTDQSARSPSDQRHESSSSDTSSQHSPKVSSQKRRRSRSRSTSRKHKSRKSGDTSQRRSSSRRKRSRNRGRSRSRTPPNPASGRSGDTSHLYGGSSRRRSPSRRRSRSRRRSHSRNDRHRSRKPSPKDADKRKKD